MSCIEGSNPSVSANTKTSNLGRGSSTPNFPINRNEDGGLKGALTKQFNGGNTVSQIDSILGLPDLAILAVEPRKHPCLGQALPRPVCIYCGAASVNFKATCKRDLKHTRQGNQLLVLLSVPKYHCKACGRYFRLAYALRATSTGGL